MCDRSLSGRRLGQQEPENALDQGEPKTDARAWTAEEGQKVAPDTRNVVRCIGDAGGHPALRPAESSEAVSALRGTQRSAMVMDSLEFVGVCAPEVL